MTAYARSVLAEFMQGVRGWGAALTGKGRALSSERAHAARLVARADAARDAGCFHAAALLYEDALRHAPQQAAIHIQGGHMFKEAGDLENAERHYLAARRLTPDDPDLALQLGHFFKVAGRLDEAEAAYRRALALKPDWSDVSTELAGLRRPVAWQADIAEEAASLGLLDSLPRLVPELVPRKPEDLRRRYVDSIQLRRLGTVHERAQRGPERVLRGIDAVRGFCIGSVPLHGMQVVLGGRSIYAGALRGAPVGNGQFKHVFNLWLDLSRIPPGRQEIELRFLSDGQVVRVHREPVVVAPPLPAADPGSDSVVDLAAAAPSGRVPDARASNAGVPETGALNIGVPGATATDDRALAQRINAQPSVVRDARRSVFPVLPSSVLVMRTDQLGDMVTSIPAMRRLRALLPQARIVGLLTAANADFARTLGLFDEVIVADFPDVWDERRRVMPLATQEALRLQLEPYRFDLAIDLAESAVSRPLLLLSGARFLYGFYDRDWPWLDGGFEGSTRDRHNGLEVAPQSTKVLALIERLGAAFTTRAEVIRRPDLGWDMLAQFGIAAGDAFAVLHTGARIPFSRWPFYAELASLLLARTGLRVMLLTDDAQLRRSLPAALLDSDRFRLVDRRLAFDDLDALLSFCSVFVGNDSGPKHLAALRGAEVVSIHSSRINWGEWGQELTGSIISRRVPCAGCAIYHDDDECGKDFACIVKITPEEVFAAVSALLRRDPGAAP